MAAGTNFFYALLMLLLTVSGGPPGSAARRNDLLDMIPTASYWRVKAVVVTREQLEADIGAVKPAQDIPKLVKDLESLSRRDNAKKQLAAVGTPALDLLRAETTSEDPEAAAMARELIATITQHGMEPGIRRLMAIRTLGERKEKDSLPLLKSLADSKELFVADYAARAVSQIEGTPLKPLAPVNLAADLDLLPSTTGIVGQTTGLGLPGFSFETLADQMIAIKPGMGVDPLNPADKNAAVDNLTRQLLNIAEATGNLRIDGATLAVSADIGGMTDWFAFTFHGTFDPEAIAAYSAKMARGNPPVVRDGKMLKIAFDRDATIVIPGNDRFIVAASNPANTPILSLLEPMLAALTTGKPNTLAENKALGDLLKTVDKTGPLWMAAIPSPKMRSLSPLMNFDSITLSAKETKDGYVLLATGVNPADRNAALDSIESGRKIAAEALSRLLAQSPDFKPAVTAIQAGQVGRDERSISATTTVSPDVLKGLLVLIISEFPMTQPQPVDAGAEVRERLR